MEAWKDKPIVSITSADVRKRYEEMATKGLRGKGPAPVQANIAMTTLRTLINFTMTEYARPDGKPLIDYNPVTILRRELKPSAPRTRQIDRRKVGEVWNMLGAARIAARDADARAGVDLVRLLMLTGGRRNECAMLTWDRVNIDDNDPTNCWWYLPDPKNRNPVTLPLSSLAVAILKARKPAEDDKEASPFVFPSRSKAGHVMDTRAPLEQISKAIGMERLSAHDLRRTFVTLGVKACRLDVAKLELLTNHIPQSITAKHYLETSDLRDYYTEVQAIADFIETEAAVAKAKANGDNVVSLHA
jgi:integrase